MVEPRTAAPDHETAPTDCSPRWAAALGLASVLIGLVYVFAVGRGTPSDEVGHYQNCRYVATHMRLPIMGQPDTNYESYQAPGFMVLGALVYTSLLRFGETTSFRGIRVADLLLMIPLTVLTYSIVRRIWPRSPIASIVAAMFVALNPCLIGIAASAQNDILAMTMTFLAILVAAILFERGDFRASMAILLGVIVSAALLVKLSTILVAAGIVVWAAVSGGVKRGLKFSAVVIVTVVALTGWMFIRNERLYGDATGVAALVRIHPESTSAPAPLMRFRYQALLVEAMVSYYWMPNEVYRNLIKIPKSLLAPILLVSGLACAGALLWLKDIARRRSRGDPISQLSLFLPAVYAASFVIYAYEISHANFYPPRALYPVYVVFPAALGCFAAWLAAALGPAAGRAFTAALGALLIVGNVATLVEAKRMPVYEFNRTWSTPLPSGPDGLQHKAPPGFDD